jgi:hypothetical protein
LPSANTCSILGGVTAAPARTLPELRQIAARSQPTVLAREQVLPVLPALGDLLPGGALPRGTTVGVGGPAATSLALALAARASAAGSWIAVVGVPELGLAAASELGLCLERVVLVGEPSPASWGSVVAALVGAFDVVVLAPTHRVRRGDARRLAARARERGSVLVQLGDHDRSSLECDVRLTTDEVQWHGLERGHGHLQARRVQVAANGRRQASRHREVHLWLPDADGRIAVVDVDRTGGTVTSLRAVRVG